MSFLARSFANIGLQWRILLSVAVGLFIALGGLAFLSLRYMGESTDRSLSEQLVIAQLTASHIDHVLDETVTQLQAIANSPAVEFADGNLANEQAAMESAYRSMRISVTRLLLIDRTGRVALVVPDQPGIVGLDYSPRLYVQRSLASALPAIATAFGAGPEGRQGVGVAVPVRDPTGRLAGLVSGEIDFSQRGLTDLLQPVTVGQTGYLQLVDENGLVLGSTQPPAARLDGRDPESTFTSHPEYFPKLIRESQPVVQVCHTCHQSSSGLERGRDIMAFAPLSSAPFGVAVRLTEGDVYAARDQLRLMAVLYSTVVLLAGLLFAWLSTNAVVRPLEHLTVAARRIGGGDLESPVELAGRSAISETTTLAATLEAMRRRLRASYERIERLNRGLEERVAQRTRELSILFEVSQTLTTTVDVDTLMQMVVDKIVSVVDVADAAIFFRLDAAQQLLEPRAAVGYHFAPLSHVRLRAGEAMAGRVLAAGHPVLFAGADEVREGLSNSDPTNFEYLRLAREGLAQPAGALGAPIVFEGQVTGVLLLVNLRQPGSFDRSDIAMVQAVADQVAVAIEHARLVQEASQVAALREADRLKSEFLYNVSHELRTPLSSIVSLVEVLATDYRTITRRQLGQVLSIVGRSAGRLKDMVENLLDAGSVQAGRFRVQQEPVVLSQIVHEAIACLQPQLDDKVQHIDVRLEPDLVVAAHRDRIVQVLVNLISNSNKYCPRGEQFDLTATREDDSVRIALSDSGPGIAAEDQAHLFEPFYRSALSLSVAGAGLGLAIVKAIVEAHGGQITLESHVGVGTTVSFTLPLAPPDSGPLDRDKHLVAS